MPLTKLQSEVLRALSAQRSPDSYIAGGIALNREGPRFSRDIDIFQDSQKRVELAAEADAIHENILPLGEVVCAAVGRFPGQSPEEMLADITRHSRFDAEQFRALAMVHPVDVPGLHRRIRSMIEDADQFVQRIPSDAIGFVFLKEGKPVQPKLEALDTYERHAGSQGGVWPSSGEISTAMLEAFNERPLDGDA